MNESQKEVRRSAEQIADWIIAEDKYKTDVESFIKTVVGINCDDFIFLHFELLTKRITLKEAEERVSRLKQSNQSN